MNSEKSRIQFRKQIKVSKSRILGIWITSDFNLTPAHAKTEQCWITHIPISEIRFFKLSRLSSSSSSKPRLSSNMPLFKLTKLKTNTAENQLNKKKLNLSFPFSTQPFVPPFMFDTQKKRSFLRSLYTLMGWRATAAKKILGTQAYNFSLVWCQWLVDIWLVLKAENSVKRFSCLFTFGAMNEDAISNFYSHMHEISICKQPRKITSFEIDVWKAFFREVWVSWAEHARQTSVCLYDVLFTDGQTRRPVNGSVITAEW
jgi:hypothetical protein